MFHVKQKRVAFRSPAGACLLCRLLPLPFVCLSAPIPPTPFPAGRGRPRLFYARGSAPCIPGAEPGRHWLNRGGWRPGTPAAKPGRHWLFSAASVLFAPIPPAPLPVGKGDFCFILPGATAPGTPAAKPGRHWLFLSRQCFLPPSPRPPSPAGKGEIFGFLMQGAPPLASPGLNPGGTGSIGGAGAPAPLLLNPRGAGYAFRTQAHKILSKHPLIRNALVNAYL